MPKQILHIDDRALLQIASSPYSIETPVSPRSVLRPYLDKAFLVQLEATEEVKTIDGRRCRLFKNISSRLLLTGGVVESITTRKTFNFHHSWLDDFGQKPGGIYVDLAIACEYVRHNGTKELGFRRVDFNLPNDTFEVNFRMALALLDLQLSIGRSHSWKLDDEEVRTLLSATISALADSSLYCALKRSESRQVRGVLSLLNIWLEVLTQPVIVSDKSKKAKKSKSSKGFARV